MTVYLNAPHDFNMSDADDTFGEFLAYLKVQLGAAPNGRNRLFIACN